MGRPVGSKNKEALVAEKVEKIPTFVDKPVENVPRGEVKPKERQFSGENDHKGAYHPLCMSCNHREDMHFEWKEIHKQSNWKNPMTGQDQTREWVEKVRVDDRGHPCQHACKCTEYK